MKVIAVLDDIFLQPLLGIVDEIFTHLLSFSSPGVALLLLSVVVNFLLFPMYAHMEEAGKARSVKLEKMRGEICRIRPHFQGRERYFYIRAVHRHYGYRPFDALLRSSDLIVQILVFMTIYRYLLESDDLLGQSFLGIADLSRPDALLGGVHLLPFVMTAVNIFAIISYEQTPTKRTQGFVLTGIFLLLLYPSPSGLVVYWTANNLISWSKSALVPALFARLPVKFREDVRRWALQE